MKLPPYPKYKPSGVEWLGDVPEHWHVHRIKWAVTGCVNGIWGEEPNEIDDLICIRVADFNRQNFSVVTEPATLRAIDKKQLPTRLLKQGDLLIEKSGGGEKQLVGCVVSFDLPVAAVSSNFVARMPIAPNQNSRFWTYAHASLYSGKINYLSVKQTTGIQNLDASSYLDTIFAYPPIEEQSAIASFLDATTGRIDVLIGKKRELIERLGEKRRALISRCVTRGLPPPVAEAANLNPHPKLKDTGIDWLGEIPEHWEVVPLKRVARIGNGSTPKRDQESYWEEGSFPWLNSSVVNQREVTEATQFVTEKALLECHLPIIDPPAVLVGITGQGKTRGMASILKIRATINQHVAYLKPQKRQIEINFLANSLYSCYEFLRHESEGAGSTKGAITCEQLANHFIAAPPVEEQTAIAAYLDTETAKLDRLVTQVEAAIERLHEYRTALITAAVTGKIDVRNHPDAQE